MKFINYLKAITGVEIYPLISLLIFVIFFALLIFWVIKANKNFINAVKNIPLEEDNDKQQNI